MIARLHGTLEELREGIALVRCGSVSYEVLVPAADQMRLAGAVGNRMHSRRDAGRVGPHPVQGRASLDRV